MKIVGHGNRDHIKEQRRTTKTIKAVLVNGSQTETHFSFPNATMDHCLAGPWADTAVRPSDDSYIYDVPMGSMQK